MMTQVRPQSNEYAPPFKKYIDVVPDGEPLKVLQDQLADWQRVLTPMGEEAGNFRYAQEKWSIKEMLGHVIDAERIFSYRLLRIARGDKTPLPGFEQDDYIKEANSSKRQLADLRAEFEAVRRASLFLVASLDEQALQRTGTASNNPISARALLFIIAGHDRHHFTILRKKYLPALGER
jgi:uncharacterized damage-inducible protein DinB